MRFLLSFLARCSWPLRLCLAGLCLLLLPSQRAWAQAPAADSGLVAVATSSLGQHYAHGLREESRLYSGPEYVSYLRRDTKGHQFFGTEEAQPATIDYAGTTYPNVPLRYDLVRGQLVLRALLVGVELRLVNENVTRFRLGSHSFIRLVADSAGSSPVRTGYYELLVEGPVRVLGAYAKQYEERATPTGIESEVRAKKDEYFVYRAGHYTRITKAGTLLDLFPQDKAALRKFSKANKLKFKGDRRGAAIAALVRYQASLAPVSPVR